MADLFPDMKLEDITIRQKLDELERELKMRHEVYPRQVERGNLGREVARDRILILRAIIADYRQRLDLS